MNIEQLNREQETDPLLNTPKRAKIKGNPIVLFEKMPIDSSLASGLFTIADVAELLKISASTVRRLQQQRIIPFLKVGGSVRFRIDDIETYVANIRVESIDRI